MLGTIHKINDILKEEGKNKNTENIITKTINGGKHAFDLIQFIHNTEVEYYKDKIKKLEQQLKILKDKYEVD